MQTIKAQFNAADWKARMNAAGYQIRASGCVVTLIKHIGPGNREGFVECDMLTAGYLYELPKTSPGSVWGTDGGSVGGMVAIRSGVFELNRSGISKRVVAALAK